MRVQPGEGQAGAKDGGAAGSGLVAGILHLLPADRTPGRERPVGKEERGPGPPDHDEGSGRPVQEDADARDAQQDQHEVRDRADCHHHDDVRALDALPEDKSVLRADGNDEGQPGGETGKQGKDHHSTVGARRR
ncbi:hypothetical protein SRABI128_05975 [Microbacterium sp. Bi128]|nr:hypothetical protein SRABI128_05975 [Microbacterium sp. Bi128]